MKVVLLVVGKTTNKHLETLISDFTERLGHYTSFSLQAVPDVRGLGKAASVIRQAEGDAILRNIQTDDRVVLLDEKGVSLTSRGLASFVEKRLAMGRKRLVFVVGGATGFADSVRQRADDVLSLSPMTMTHQMVRLFFVEQLYRAFTILRGESYHNE